MPRAYPESGPRLFLSTFTGLLISCDSCASNRPSAESFSLAMSCSWVRCRVRMVLSSVWFCTSRSKEASNAARSSRRRELDTKRATQAAEPR